MHSHPPHAAQLGRVGNPSRVPNGDYIRMVLRGVRGSLEFGGWRDLLSLSSEIGFRGFDPQDPYLSRARSL